MGCLINENYNPLLETVIDIFKSKCRPGYTPLYLPGKTFVEHFSLQDEDIDHFFNLMCYELKVLSINPGSDEMSYHWEQNDFGLLEPYLTQLKRDNNLTDLGI
jgi:hypothetical protein